MLCSYQSCVVAEMTHLLPSDQEQTALFAVQDLSGDYVQEQEITPAAVQQLHLVTHLGEERKRKAPT